MYTDTQAFVSGHHARSRSAHNKFMRWFLGERTVRSSMNPATIKQCSLLFRTKLFYEFAGFDLNYGLAADYHFIHRVLAKKRTRTIQSVSATFYLDGISSLNRRRSLSDQQLVIREIGKTENNWRLGIFFIFAIKYVRAWMIDQRSKRFNP